MVNNGFDEAYLIIKSIISCACGSPRDFCAPKCWQETTYVNFKSARASSTCFDNDC